MVQKARNIKFVKNRSLKTDLYSNWKTARPQNIYSLCTHKTKDAAGNDCPEGNKKRTSIVGLSFSGKYFLEKNIE